MTQELSRQPLTDIVDADLDTMTATKETLEDYTLRFAPRSYRKWSTRVVGISALGGVAYLADFATGFPVAYYSARYNIDLDLVTRGSGFGYYGSVVTNVVFCDVHVHLLRARGLDHGPGPQSRAAYPVVVGLRRRHPDHLSAGDLWHESAFHTSSLDNVALADPDGRTIHLSGGQPSRFGEPVLRVSGRERNGWFRSRIDAAGRGCLPFAQQNDYLRFMPPQTPENKRSWWTWLMLAGPGWVFFGAIKQIVGLFFAVYLIANVADSTGTANQPVTPVPRDLPQLPTRLACHDACGGPRGDQPDQDQRHNAYSGSLAWTNSFTRVTKHYPGRIVFLGVDLSIALILMEADMFSFLNTTLGFYANCGMAWLVVVASYIAINKYLLKLSPMKPEFRRGMLYAVNPVGFGSMLIAAGLSVVAFFGGLGEAIRPYSPLGRHRARSGAAAYLRHRDEGQVLPAAHGRRDRFAHV
jgi:hypothetical protein